MIKYKNVQIFLKICAFSPILCRIRQPICQFTAVHYISNGQNCSYHLFFEADEGHIQTHSDYKGKEMKNINR